MTQFGRIRLWHAAVAGAGGINISELLWQRTEGRGYVEEIYLKKLNQM
jgi:hypothetical protein